MTNVIIQPEDYPFSFTTDEEGLKKYIRKVANSIDDDISEWYELKLIEQEMTLDEIMWEGELNQDLGGFWHCPKFFNDTITIDGTSKKVCDLIDTIDGTFDATEDNTEKIYNALMAAL